MRMRNNRRGCALLAAMCVLLVACTAKSANDAGGPGTTSGSGAGPSAGNTVGITATTIKVSMISADLSQLSSQHLAPEIGDADKTMKAVVADINAHGGVAGRKILLISHVLHGTDAILNPDLGRQACVQATEDDKPFAVILTASLPAAMVQCVGGRSRRAHHHDGQLAEQPLRRGQGPLVLAGLAHLHRREPPSTSAWPGVLDGAGLLKGKTIGIIRQDLADQQEVTDDALVPGIKALGYKVAAEAVLPCPEGSQTCEQQTVAIQRMQDAGVNVVFLVAQTLAGSTTVQAAQTRRLQAAVDDRRQQRHQHGRQVLRQRQAELRRRLRARHRLHATSPRPRPAATRSRWPAAPRSSRRSNDGYGFTAVTCIQMQSLAQAIKAVKGTVDQASVIAALQQLDPVLMLAGPPGSISRPKPYAGTSVFISRYSAATQTFQPIDNRKPIVIAP